MTQKMLDKIKGFYEKGIYTYTDVEKMLEAGKITLEEFTYIVGENDA